MTDIWGLSNLPTGHRPYDATVATGATKWPWGQRPWECPRCHQINAWWVPRCNCKPDVRQGNDDLADE
jgi:hypothetical protein